MQEAFCRRNDFDDAPVGGHDQVASAQHLPARKHERRLFARGEMRAQPAFLSRVERKLQPALGLEAVRLTADFVPDLEHQNRKYLCAIGRTFARPPVSSSPSTRPS